MDKVIFSLCVYRWQDNICVATADLNLPAGEYELRDTLEKVRDGEEAEIIAEIEDYGRFGFLRKRLSEVDDIWELNTLAEKLADLKPWQADALEGLVHMDEKKGMEVSLPRVYDLACCVDDCHVLYDVTDFSELGRFYAENDLVPELENVPDEAWELLDFSKIGQKVIDSGTGAFLRGDRGYVDFDGEIVERFADLDLTPKEPDYTVLLEVALWDTGESVMLKLPCSRSGLDAVLTRLEADDWTKISWRCSDCRIPALRDAFSLADSIEIANYAAGRLADLPEQDLLPYKALVTARETDDLAEAMELLDRLPEYTFTRSYVTPIDVALDQLSFILDEPEAGAIRPFVDLHRYGEYIIESQHISMTPYGAIERQDGGPVMGPLERRGQEMGGMTMM